ncbi:hypothetical protein [Breoghania sp.]|uniref:hypothetical protein n=1 Tax=Breoghania sp. TaxID=2065378 RepID=UPI002AA888A0|nr:hypothetical protein [Breoghania sp.]
MKRVSQIGKTVRFAFACASMALGLTLNALPTQADPLGLNDYPALFDAYPDRIVLNANGSETLTLPDGVKVIRMKGRYVGFDPKGAVGCPVQAFIAIEAYGERCPDLMSEKQAVRFEANKATLIAFYAQNAYPAVSRKQVRERYDEMVALSAKQEFSCDDPSPDVVHKALTGLLDARALAKILAIPRLPVSDPCL